VAKPVASASNQLLMH